MPVLHKETKDEDGNSRAQLQSTMFHVIKINSYENKLGALKNKDLWPVLNFPVFLVALKKSKVYG